MLHVTDLDGVTTDSATQREPWQIAVSDQLRAAKIRQGFFIALTSTQSKDGHTEAARAQSAERHVLGVILDLDLLRHPVLSEDVLLRCGTVLLLFRAVEWVLSLLANGTQSDERLIRRCDSAMREL